MAPLGSLVLITHNSMAVLPRCLDTLFDTDYEPFEVIVVDNESTDGTREFLEAYPKPLHLIANQVGVGPHAGFNQGLAAARGDLFMVLNPDIFFTPAWLSVLVKNFEARPDAAITCPTTLYPDEQARAAPASVGETAAVPLVMVRREAWEDIGPWDEAMFLYW